MSLVTRSIPLHRALDENKGIIEYIASDETVDSYKEVIRASAWRFNLFKRNPAFFANHDYQAEKCIGKVLEYSVKSGRLVEVVQYALGVDNKLAESIYKMVKGGFMPACSVGFWPVKRHFPGESEHTKQLQELGLKADAGVQAIYTEVEQIELSAVGVGANSNAVVQARAAGCLTDTDIETISAETAERETASYTTNPADVLLAQRQAQEAQWQRIETALQRAKENSK